MCRSCEMMERAAAGLASVQLLQEGVESKLSKVVRQAAKA